MRTRMSCYSVSSSIPQHGQSHSHIRSWSSPAMYKSMSRLNTQLAYATKIRKEELYCDYILEA